MSFFGLAFALLMVVAGLIAWRWPELISSYSMMSRKELANVDLKAAGRTSLVTMCATAVAVLALYYPLYYTGHYTLAIELSIVAVFAGCIALVYALRKYDRNPGRKKGTVAVAVTAVVTALASDISRRDISGLKGPVRAGCMSICDSVHSYSWCLMTGR